MEVTVVDRQAPFHLCLLDADYLDPKGAGEGALETLLKQPRLGQVRSSAAPAS